MRCRGVFEDRTGQHDYRFRAYLDRDRVADRITEQISAIRYPNFKEVTDKRRHYAYFHVWDQMYELQEQLAAGGSQYSYR